MCDMLTWVVPLLLLLCSGAAVRPERSCAWLSRYGDLSNASVSLLDQMGDRMTDQRCPIPFPEAFYRHVRKAKVEEKLVFIRDSLREVIELYRHGNLSSVSWDQNKTERFLITMDRQAREINSCVTANEQSAKQTHRPTDRQADTEKHRKMSHYYKKLLRCTVHRMGGSAASWELIRQESKKHLEMLDFLQASIPRPGSG